MTRERYEARVESIDDPEKRGRIKVSSRALVEEGVELPDWVEPAFPYVGKDGAGFFFLPDVGEFVEIEAVGSDDDEDVRGAAFLSNPDLRWVACLYSDTASVPAEFREKYGKRMGIKTPSGSFLMFDEDAKELVLKSKAIRLGSSAANENLVLGKKLKDFLGELLDAILAITQPASPAATTGPLNNATQFEALRAKLDALLSDFVFTEKGTPPG